MDVWALGLVAVASFGGTWLGLSADAAVPRRAVRVAMRLLGKRHASEGELADGGGSPRRDGSPGGGDSPRKGVAGRRAKASIARDMPTFLDIVTLGLAAGLSFDASIELYCKRFDTTLSSTLWDTLLLWRMGVRSRSDALGQMAERMGVAALTRFTQTVTEALAFGTPLAQTLERQAQVLRDEQKALVEEEIERVPVKMLIPLGTLIVPAMLLAILGPLLGPALSMA